MVQVRIAEQGDIGAVDALLMRAYPRLLRDDYEADLLARALPVISRAQPELVTCGTYWVVEDKGAFVGAGGWTPETPGTGRVVTGIGHIRHVVTDDRAVRRGVGRALMGHVVAQAKMHGIEQLQCFSTLTAVGFYEAMGFVQCGGRVIPLGPDLGFPSMDMTRDIRDV